MGITRHNEVFRPKLDVINHFSTELQGVRQMVVSCEDEISGVREVTRYQEGAGGLVSMSEQVFVTQSRQHQDGADTGGITGTNIGNAVADKYGIVEIKAKLVARSQEHAGARLATGTTSLFTVWTVIHLFDMSTCCLNPRDHPSMDILNHLNGDEATRDNRLIGADDKAMACLCESGNRLTCTSNKMKLFPLLDVICSIFVNDAIAVNKDTGQFLYLPLSCRFLWTR